MISGGLTAGGCVLAIGASLTPCKTSSTTRAQARDMTARDIAQGQARGMPAELCTGPQVMTTSGC